MSTRGAVGFRVRGIDKITYNHSSSDPESLGESIVRWCRDVDDWKSVKKAVMDMKKAKSQSPTDDELLDLCIRLGKEYPSTSLKWYNLLRDTQGDPSSIIEAKYYIDYKEFLMESLFCEWAYIINLDNMELEIYEGYQKIKHARGRYTVGRGRVPGGNGFFPVALVGEFDLLNIPGDWRLRIQHPPFGNWR